MGETSPRKKIIPRKVKPVPFNPIQTVSQFKESRKRMVSNRLEWRKKFEKNLEKDGVSRSSITGLVRRNRRYRSYEDAQKFVKTKKLKTRSEWLQFTTSGELPIDIPAHPDFVYGRNTYFQKSVNNRGWVNYETWLGLKPPKYRSFENARKFARSLKITTIDEWNLKVRTGMVPKDIPESPVIYDEFEGWYDFFGCDKNTIVDRKLRFQYRVLFDRQLNYFHNLNQYEKKIIELIMGSLNFKDEIDFDDVVYNEMKLSLPSKADSSNLQMILAECNSYLKLKNMKFLETIFPKMPPKERRSIYKNLDKTSVVNLGDLINSDSIPNIAISALNWMKCHAIVIIFGKKIGNTFGEYYQEYTNIFINYLAKVYKYDKILEKLQPITKRFGEISSKAKNFQIEFTENREVIKLAKKTLKIINKAEIKKYKIGETRSFDEIKLLHLQWHTASILNQYDEMLSLENEFLNNDDLGYAKSTIYSNISEAYLRRGKISKSLSYVQKAIDSKPNDPSSWFNKACIHAMSGDVDFACNSLLVAIGLGGNEIISDAKTDKDFSKIKNSDQFKKIINSSKKKLFKT
jgi:tetratricopeptide (TPR) repeat protein